MNTLDAKLTGRFNLASVRKHLPNPVGNQTLIEVQSVQSGSFCFEVFDLLGNRLHSQPIQLIEGGEF